MTSRTEIHCDGTYNDQTGVGGWAAVSARTSSGRQDVTSSYEMELRALVETVKMADGPCSVISDQKVSPIGIWTVPFRTGPRTAALRLGRGFDLHRHVAGLK
jgi:hypothetical protein